MGRFQNVFKATRGTKEGFPSGQNLIMQINEGYGGVLSVSYFIFFGLISALSLTFGPCG